jgi:hypothetical protein
MQDLLKVMKQSLSKVRKVHRLIRAQLSRYRCHLQSFVAARIDAPKWGQIHINVERQTVVTPASTHLQTECSYLPALHIDPSGRWIATGGDAKIGQTG